MKRVMKHMGDLAMCLIAYERSGNEASETPIAFSVCEKLRPQLSTLTGSGGFRVLLARSLALASLKIPWLRAVEVTPAGLMLLGELKTQVEPTAIAEGGVVLLTQLLDLLATFIGEKLTLGIVREVWPELPLDEFDVGRES